MNYPLRLTSVNLLATADSALTKTSMRLGGRPVRSILLQLMLLSFLQASHALILGCGPIHGAFEALLKEALSLGLRLYYAHREKLLAIVNKNRRTRRWDDRFKKILGEVAQWLMHKGKLVCAHIPGWTEPYATIKKVLSIHTKPALMCNAPSIWSCHLSLSRLRHKHWKPS